MLFWIAHAVAAEPTTTIGADGAVELRCTVDASIERVRATLSDPVAAGRLSPDTLSVSATPLGNCLELNLQVKGVLSPLQLTAMRCPTRNGWKYSLLKSETVSDFAAEWTLTEQGERTEVVYRIRSDVNLPVPETLVQRSVLASARETLAALIRKVTRR